MHRSWYCFSLGSLLKKELIPCNCPICFGSYHWVRAYDIPIGENTNSGKKNSFKCELKPVKYWVCISAVLSFSSIFFLLPCPAWSLSSSFPWGFIVETCLLAYFPFLGCLTAEVIMWSLFHPLYMRGFFFFPWMLEAVIFQKPFRNERVLSVLIKIQALSCLL